MYRISIQKANNWRDHSHADIGVSMVSPVTHIEEKTFALLEWTAKRFETLSVSLGDSLHRWNIMNESEVNENAARALSNLMGDAWIEKFSLLIEKHDIKIIRWDQAIGHKDFQTTLNAFNTLYNGNTVFANAFNSDIDFFIERKLKDGTNLDPQATRRFSHSYLMEELAADTLLAKEKPGAYLYIGSELKSYAAIRNGEVTNAPSGLEFQPHVAVGFKRLKGQQMEPVTIKRHASSLNKMPVANTSDSEPLVHCA